jgi:peptidoglycan/xylan/chitin deacetylase (PgdA/CDA1 family)
VINWSVDSRDWKYGDNIVKVRNCTLKDVRGGAILLFHTMSGKEPSKIIGSFLPELIQTLQNQGYQFVTVDELLSVPAYR